MSDEVIQLSARIAHRHPRVALALLLGEWAPVAYTMELEFPVTPSESSIRQVLPEAISCDLLVDDIVYSVLRPSYNVNSLFRSQEEVNDTLIPGITLELEVNDCPEFLISSAGTPIEHVIRPSPLPLRMRWPFFLTRNATLVARATLVRDVDPTELPIRLYITVLGYRLVCGFWQRASVEECDDILVAWHGSKYIRRSVRGIRG